jgi:hypothetical protein
MKDEPASELHEKRRALYEAEAARHETRSNRLAFVSLALVALAVGFAIFGFTAESPLFFVLAAGSFVAFLLCRGVQARVLAARDMAQTRRDIHQRHIARTTHDWQKFPNDGGALLPKNHAYAFDIDLVGPGSLFQRIDVTHTIRGETALARWLGAPAVEDVIRARQRAVEELARSVDFRQELEATAEIVQGDGKLDDHPFLAFTMRKPFFADRRYLLFALPLPIVTVTLLVLAQLGIVNGWYSVVPFAIQVAIAVSITRRAHEVFDLVSARRGTVEAFYKTLETAEKGTFESEALKALQARLAPGGERPSQSMRRLDRWAGFSDLRTQVLLYIPVNFGLLWDLHVLYQLERWNRSIGKSLDDIFEALGELEALASLATLHSLDPAAAMPEIGSSDAAFTAEDIAHPLIPAADRIANDVALRGPGTGLIVTGSNMAGKSTLLRAVGLNIALALAGGPVIAKKLRVPIVRLRASMRANDDLQRGASYFHAELQKLRTVVEGAEQAPPVFFLLDELLRGTNARARHLGGRAVVLHLLERRATGLVATHDIALSELEDERPDRVANAHFTDVVQNGEMTFDYLLQPGVVRTSNALRLLSMAGIDVEVDDSVSGVSELRASAPDP